MVPKTTNATRTAVISHFLGEPLLLFVLSLQQERHGYLLMCKVSDKPTHRSALQSQKAVSAHFKSK